MLDDFWNDVSKDDWNINNTKSQAKANDSRNISNHIMNSKFPVKIYDYGVWTLKLSKLNDSNMKIHNFLIDVLLYLD